MSDPASGPLAGIRVLDLSRLLPGGYGTLLLSDLGADVVKVEEPGRGDYIRWTPPLVDGESAAHRALNRGKRSITLDLKHADGPRVLRALARRADVLVESFRPGVMDRLGVGEAVLRGDDPRLVYCAITGYGQDGPYRSRAGHDINYLGYAGALSMTGDRHGPPVVPGVQVGDLGGASIAAIGVLAALLERGRTGEGRFVDVSMTDGVVSWLSIHAAAYLASGDPPLRGEAPLSGGYACYRVYRCRDGRFLTVGALEPQFWRAVCEVLGRPDLVDRQFGPPEEQERIAAAVQSILETRDRSDWLEAFEGVAACVGPVNDLGEALADPQIVSRRMLAEVDGAVVGPTSPLKLGDVRPGSAPGTVAATRAPSLGEHTDEVLADAGFSVEEVARLRASRAV